MAENYYRHPCLAANAAEWLIERRVKMLGVDTITPDLAGLKRGPDFKYAVHPLLLGAEILIVEHLNLEAVAGDMTELTSPLLQAAPRQRRAEVGGRVGGGLGLEVVGDATGQQA